MKSYSDSAINKHHDLGLAEMIVLLGMEARDVWLFSPVFSYLYIVS